MTPVAFFDDDREKWGTTIHGIPVEGPPEGVADFLHRHRLDEVIIAMPSASGRRIRDVVTLTNQLKLKSAIVPSYEQLVTGQRSVSQIRAVEISDLLGREPVNLEIEKIRELINGRTILVTGAGGSIGSELCRQIASFQPLRLLLVERCEVQLFQIEQELISLGHGAQIVPIVADILDEDRLRIVMRRFNPNIVFHAAAHKHVPMMESQPAEAIRNNTLGTRLVARLAGEFKVERFVLISTDKAINPTSVMGATKRLAELLLQDLSRSGSCSTRYMAVRFGNVLGSSGSVIPTFKKQIEAGGPVTVTHPDICRYFMTVQEAVGLVLESAAIGRGGEIYVLDMGKLVKIVDVAQQLIELSGLRVDSDIEIRFTGLRPGEKLFEEITMSSELFESTEHPKVFRLLALPTDSGALVGAVEALSAKLTTHDAAQLKLELKQLIPEYTPYMEIA